MWSGHIVSGDWMGLPFNDQNTQTNNWEENHSTIKGKEEPKDRRKGK